MGTAFNLVIFALIILSTSSISSSVYHRAARGGRHRRGGFIGAVNYDERFPGDNPNVKIFNFTQMLDHFDAQETRTFSQKVWVNDQYYKPGGPGFVFLGGEGPTARKWIDPNEGVADWLRNAKRHNALCFQLEHRYYGDTHPTADRSTENLKWLSSRQALADIAHFIEAMKTKYSMGPESKWITFGGSYSGALSAWYRLKYPHSVVGAVATSGPVQAEYNFKEYLGVVANSLGTHSKDCLSNVAAATKKIQNMLKTSEGVQKLEKDLNICSKLDTSVALDVSNLYQNLAQNIAFIIQYSQDNRGVSADILTIPNACSKMTNSSVPDVYDRYINVQKLYMTNMGESCFEVSYSKMINEMKIPEWNDDSDRQWTYQTCTEFSYFQSSDLVDQPFGHDFNISFIQKICSDVFGPQFNAQFTQAAVDDTNTFYGGKDLESSDTVLPNGSLDPWHYLGILKSQRPSDPAIYIQGTAHCANMYPARADDLPDLVLARAEILRQIDGWLGK